MFRRYLSFLKLASDEFSEIVANAELHAGRVRLILIDGSLIDVRYPVEDKFSFHWQRGDRIYRIDTAPHHTTKTSVLFRDISTSVRKIMWSKILYYVRMAHRRKISRDLWNG